MVTADTTAPTVSISSPANGSTVSGTIDVNGTASDNVGVAGVQFKLDGANLGAEDTDARPTTSAGAPTGWPTARHTLTAVARDAGGQHQDLHHGHGHREQHAPPPAWWRAYGFEETSGTTAVDSSGSGNPGTINGP